MQRTADALLRLGQKPSIAVVRACFRAFPEAHSAPAPDNRYPRDRKCWVGYRTDEHLR
jgi:hypothetical protein